MAEVEGLECWWGEGLAYLAAREQFHEYDYMNTQHGTISPLRYFDEDNRVPYMPNLWLTATPQPALFRYRLCSLSSLVNWSLAFSKPSLELEDEAVPVYVESC